MDDDFPEPGPDPGIPRRRVLQVSAGALGLAVVAPRRKRAPAAAAVPSVDVASATIVNGGLVAAIHATAPARIKLQAWPSSNPNAVTESVFVPTNAANAALISLPSAATPGAAWSWRGVVTDPTGTLPPVNDVVRTLPARPAPGAPSKFTFAFGACIIQKQAIPALTVAKNNAPVFFTLQGDLGYQDNPALFPNTQNYAGYVALFRTILAAPEMSSLLSSTAFFAVQDDHDYGKNDCYAATIEPYAGQAYADMIPGAVWPGVDYRSWSVGQADFFLTDNRRYSDPPQPPFENGAYMSVLGTTQRNWLLNGLQHSTARVKFVFIPRTMTWYWSGGEANAVRTFINQHVSGPVVFLSGDKHAGGFAKFPVQTWELLAAPIRNPTKHKTPKRPGVLWTENGTGPALSNVIGLVDVDTSQAQTVTLRLVGEDGVELHREVVPIP